jgi:hypothetical protein
MYTTRFSSKYLRFLHSVLMDFATIHRINVNYLPWRGTAVAQWLRYYATNQVSGHGIFHWHKSVWLHYGPGVGSDSNRNEYQEYSLGVNAADAWGWQPYHHPVPVSRNLRTLTSWNPLGHSRPVTGLLLPPLKRVNRFVCRCDYHVENHMWNIILINSRLQRSN